MCPRRGGYSHRFSCDGHSSRTDASGRKSVRKFGGRRRGHRSSRKSTNGFSAKTLKAIVKLGVTGMVAMYVATVIVNTGAITSIAGNIASIIGISKDAVLYAAKGTGVAAIALRLHKELESI